METFDIILDSVNGLEEVNDDFVQGDNANNLVKYIVNANKGEFKEFPNLGVSINLLLNGSKNIQEIEREIIDQMVSDVFPDPDVDVSEFPSKIHVNKVAFDVS